MNRRHLLRAALAIPFAAPAWAQTASSAPFSRARPGQPAWPSDADWDRLGQAVGDRLVKVRSSLGVCRDAPNGAACREVFRGLKNPYYIGDDMSLTQTTGWVDAWTAQPSTFAVAPQRIEDVVAAVNFAREKNLRL